MQDDIEVVVGKRIKAVRKRKGLSQDKLAELSGLDRAHLYRLESGKQIMTIRTLQLIANTLDVRVRDLIGDL